MNRLNFTKGHPVVIVSFSILTLIILGLLIFSTSMGLWILGGLLLFLLFCFFINVGLFVTILALPIINYNIYLKGLIIPLSDFIALFLLLAFFTRFLALKFFSIQPPKKLRWPLALPFLIFLGATILSGALSQHPLDSIWYAVRWILFFYVAFVVVPVNLITTEKKLKKSIVAVVLSSTIIAVISAFSLIGQDWQHSFLRIKPVRIFNLYPIGENQNLLAEFLVIAVFFSLALKYFVTNKAAKRLLNLNAVFLALIGILTFSRAAWIVIFFQTLFFIWYQSRRLREKYVVLAMAALVCLVPLGVYMVTSQTTYNITSTENRALLSKIALESFLEKPIAGYGAGEFLNLVDRDIRFTAKYGGPLDSHGVWQKVLAENGAIGILSFAFLLASLISMCWSLIIGLYRKGQQTYFLPLVTGMAGGILFQFFNTSYYKGKVWLPVGITLAAWYLLRHNLKVYEKSEKN